MSLALLTIALLPLDLIVFDDGGIHILDDQSIVQPQDDIQVVFLSPTLSPTTYVGLQAQVRIRNANIRTNGIVVMRDDAAIQGDVVVRPQGRLQLFQQASIEGALHLIGGTTWVAGGSLADVRVEPAAALRVFGPARVEGDMMIEGDVTLLGESIAGTTTISSGMTYDRFVTNFGSDLTVEGSAVTQFADSAFGGRIVLRGAGRAEFFEGNSFGGVLQLEDTAGATFRLQSANVPAGDVTGTSGVVIGIDHDGNPMSFGFSREPGARLTISLETGFLGDVSCNQIQVNSTGQSGRIRAVGSPRVVDDNFTLITTSLPTNSFGFFFVGTAQGNGTTSEGYTVCVGGNVGRFLGVGQIKNTGSSDGFSVTIPLTTFPGNPVTPVVPGSTFVFQAWHRDILPVLGVPSHPLTNAVQVTFE